MNSGEMGVRLAQACAALALLATISGCGDQSRPIITPSNPSAPASQPVSYAVTVSVPLNSAAGVATIIDYSGDSILAAASLSHTPTGFVLDYSGTVGYTVNSDGTLTNFPVSCSTTSCTLQSQSPTYSTLPNSAQPVGMFAPTGALWLADLNGNVADVMTSSPATLQLSIPVAPTPIALVAGGSTRYYSISRNNGDYTDMSCNTAPWNVTTTGLAYAIETSNTVSNNAIVLGACPVYAVPTSDFQRVFVLNRGSDTISVINTATNALNTCTPFTDTHTGRTVTCHPSLPVTPATGLAHAGPVFAQYNATTGQLVVSNYDGNSVSVIDVSLDQYGNDSATFGTTHTIAVGKNPASVTVLNDGSRAYTANQADGTVTIIDLSSYTVEKTLAVVGHPRTVVSTQNSLYGKVYAAAPDSPYLTIIDTNLDAVDTEQLVTGNILDVRVSTQNGVQYNPNYYSWMPGSGRPCNLPDLSGSVHTDTLAHCQAMQ